MTFCTDTDLLYWEPRLFMEAAAASQVLIGGTGDLDGTEFTIESGSFTDAGVAAWQVIVLAGSIEGCFPIVSVDGATALTISVLHEGLFPSSGEPAAAAVGSGSGLTYAVRTFWPQRRLVSEVLWRAAGIDPRAEDAPAITNGDALRRAAALGALQLIHSALAASAEEPEDLLKRAEKYERMFRQALRDARVELDVDGDGAGETVRKMNLVELRRE